MKITNFSSIGGAHICGDAEESGAKWRFVIQDGKVEGLYGYNGKDYNHSRNWAKTSTKVCAAILKAALPLLLQALKECEQREKRKAAECEAENEAYRKEQQRIDALPDCLEALKELLAAQFDMQHPSDWLPGEKSRKLERAKDNAKAALKKAGCV